MTAAQESAESFICRMSVPRPRWEKVRSALPIEHRQRFWDEVLGPIIRQIADAEAVEIERNRRRMRRDG